MLTAALDGLAARTGLGGARVGEFAAGADLTHARDFNLARETVLGSVLDPATPSPPPAPTSWPPAPPPPAA